MKRRSCCIIISVVVLLIAATTAHSQTITYRLHPETNNGCPRALLTANPDAAGTFYPEREPSKWKVEITLKRRIDQATKYTSLEDLCISPQCGFASTYHGNIMTIDQEAAKLRLCVETALEVRGSL